MVVQWYASLALVLVVGCGDSTEGIKYGSFTLARCGLVSCDDFGLVLVAAYVVKVVPPVAVDASVVVGRT